MVTLFETFHFLSRQIFICFKKVCETPSVKVFSIFFIFFLTDFTAFIFLSLYRVNDQENLIKTKEKPMKKHNALHTATWRRQRRNETLRFALGCVAAVSLFVIYMAALNAWLIG